MKRFIFIMAFCLLFISCEKEVMTEDTSMVTISFSQQIVQGNSMVRSGNSNDFLNIIASQTPSYINVTLKNLDLDKTFTCKSNETITIPIGNYEISAEKDSDKVSGSTSQGINYDIYVNPNLKCDKFNYNITKETNITLNAYYNCYVIFALVDECKKCTEVNNLYNATLNKINNYYVGYFKHSSLQINLTPYDNTEYFETIFNFSTMREDNKILVEYGKYYVLHPQKINKTNSLFDLNIINMTEGNI